MARTTTSARRRYLSQLPGGRDVLIAGQKSGIIYALDPEKKVRFCGKPRIASPAANVGLERGVQWGMASDGQRVYGATSASGRTRPMDPLDTRRNILDPQMGGGLTALRNR